jgi:hypothetical protein
MEPVEVKSSINPIRHVMWAALRLAVFAFIAGMYLSGPPWEQRNAFNRKWDFVEAGFFTIISITQAIRLHRQLKGSVAPSN